MWNTMTPSFSGLTEILVMSPRSTLYFVRNDFGSNTSISESETVKMWGTAWKVTAHNLSQSHCLNTQVLLTCLNTFLIILVVGIWCSNCLSPGINLQILLMSPYIFCSTSWENSRYIKSLSPDINIPHHWSSYVSYSFESWQSLFTNQDNFPIVKKKWQPRDLYATKAESYPRSQSGTRCWTTLSSPFVSLGTSRNNSPNVLMLFGSSSNCCVTPKSSDGFEVYSLFDRRSKTHEECQWKVTQHRADFWKGKSERGDSGEARGNLNSVHYRFVCKNKQTDKERKEMEFTLPSFLLIFSTESAHTMRRLLFLAFFFHFGFAMRFARSLWKGTGTLQIHTSDKYNEQERSTKSKR